MSTETEAPADATQAPAPPHAAPEAPAAQPEPAPVLTDPPLVPYTGTDPAPRRAARQALRQPPHGFPPWVAPGPDDGLDDFACAGAGYGPPDEDDNDLIIEDDDGELD